MASGGPADYSADADRLLSDVATHARRLDRDEIRRVTEHVAHAGFDPDARERVRGQLVGMRWDGRELRRGEAIPAAQAHYLKHVRFFGEWPEPPGVSDAARLQAWIDNLREVVRDPTGGLLLSRYQDKGWGLAVVRQSRELRGPGGFDWVVIQYRLETGHWVTAFQAARGLDYFDEPSWQDKRWLRPPK